MFFVGKFHIFCFNFSSVILGFAKKILKSSFCFNMDILYIAIRNYLHSVFISPCVCTGNLRRSTFNNTRQIWSWHMGTSTRRHAFWIDVLLLGLMKLWNLPNQFLICTFKKLIVKSFLSISKSGLFAKVFGTVYLAEEAY